MYADEVLNLALGYDKSNLRAQMYKKVNAPAMSLKGIVKRVEPLSQKFSSVTEANYLWLRAQMKLNPSIDAFFNSGGSDIRTESKLQKVLDQMIPLTDDLRRFFQSHKDADIRLYTVRPSGNILDIWYYCPVQGIEAKGTYHKKYSVQNCNFLRRTEFTVDAADIEVLQHIAAGLEINAIGEAAYDLTGGATYESLTQHGKISARRHVQVLNNQSRLGKIRSAETLKFVRNLGADFYSGARWLQNMQAEVCPTGDWQENQRPDKLFDSGLCIRNARSNSVNTLFKMMQTSLAGQSISVFTSKGRILSADLENAGGNYTTQANVFAPIINPVVDLKSILPTKFDKCGRANDLGDSTVGGVFPRRDGEQVAKNIGLIADECR
jgi:hypothetical protein